MKNSILSRKIVSKITTTSYEPNEIGPNRSYPTTNMVRTVTVSIYDLPKLYKLVNTLINSMLVGDGTQK